MKNNNLNIVEFISWLHKQGINISTNGKKLFYDAPKGIVNNAIRQEIAERKIEIIEFLQQVGQVSQTTLIQIQAIPREQNLPLSFAQERLWFIEQLEGSKAPYIESGALQITGDLNVLVLQKALSEIVDRHEVLRTSFQTVNDTPIQVINQNATMKINLVDLQQLETKQQETLVIKQAKLESTTPFDLENASLIRCSLLQLSPSEYVLLLTMHHIICDGWSIGVFIHELSSLYQAFIQGQESPLTELPIQYADFAVWQRQYLSSEVLLTQLDYWKQQLSGVPDLLQLPTDYPPPSVQTYQGSTINFTLNKDLTTKLQNLARDSGTTLFMTLYAAFSTLLYRYSGQLDIVVGTPIANRNRSEIEGLIGFFVNILVLRTNFEGSPSFKELLEQVRVRTLKAYEHQDVPFEQVVEALQPQRSLSHSPLFQVTFVLQNTPMGDLELPGVTLSQMELESTISKFDLTLSMTETEQGLVGDWQYNTDLFDRSTIERMAGHFENLLSAIVENPAQKVDALPMLSATERHQLLVEWNDTAVEYPKNKCIHQLFEEQVEETPDAVAVVFEGEQLTYSKLNAKANQLADYLKSLGVKSERLVGICVERSVEMVIGLLGILKAGGAYVPLDPNYPKSRLNYMVEDAQLSIILTQEKWQHHLPEIATQVICLDTPTPTVTTATSENPILSTTPESQAYMMYTSGSTGQPKGVNIKHRGVVRLVKSTNYVSLTKEDIFLQLAPISFDAATLEIWGSLLNGGVLVIMPPHLPSLEEIGAAIRQHQVTILWLTAGLFQLMVEEQLENLKSVKQLLAGGDVLSIKHVQKVVENLTECQLINGYGPTENTTFTCCFPVKASSNIEKSVPIGKPISNTQVYILDSQLKPVPIGVPGELHISGDGLATGYHKRPELTAEKFIPNPFDNNNSKLYKTGDLTRYLPDGNIEYIGRIDNQVKLRGFRIELGEIEDLLNNHHQIKQAVVIVREDIPGYKYLVTYLVASDESLSTKELRSFSKQKLPEYMVPSAFVTLDSLPLTPNGKIDRKALPAPDDVSPEQEYVAPTTVIEKIFTQIWQELLIKEKIGIHDNFFEIGGDSILSIQVVSRAKNSGIQITPQQIFQHQTIAELATVANTTTKIQSQQGIVTGVAPLTPIQKWFLDENQPEAYHFNQSVLLQIPNNIQPELLEKAIEKLIEHHDALSLRFTQESSEYKQENYGKSETIPFTVVDLSSTSTYSQPQAIEEIATEYQASLNLSDGLIIQVVMFNLGSEVDARLLIIIHHLAVDGVSWRILLSDLETIYQQLIKEQPIQLDAKTTAFIDWAEKLYKFAQSEIIQKELDYWLNQPWSKTCSLPLDYADNQLENTVGTTAHLSVKLSAEETSVLLGSVNEAYSTQINDILLSALVISLAEWTDNSTVLIDLEGHGREELFSDVDLSRTVGWFTSLFPVLLQLPEDNQTASVIKSIKEQLRAIPNRGIGFGILRYLCQDTTVTEQLQIIPTPEISFNYLGQFDQVQSATDWKFAPESSGANHSAKLIRNHLLDINCLVVEGELQINWSYSGNVHNQVTVDNLVQSYLQAIRVIIEHCQSEDAFGYTPSDFPDAQLNQSELDDLLELLN